MAGEDVRHRLPVAEETSPSSAGHSAPGTEGCPALGLSGFLVLLGFWGGVLCGVGCAPRPHHPHMRAALGLPGVRAAGGASPPPERGFLHIHEESGNNCSLWGQGSPAAGSALHPGPPWAAPASLGTGTCQLWDGGFGMVTLGWRLWDAALQAAQSPSLKDTQPCWAWTCPIPSSLRRGGTGKLGWFCPHPAQGVRHLVSWP